MIEKQFAIKHLISGGLITNYYCTSACKHCLYACSPHWKKEYITQEAAAEIMTTIRSLGCRSIHIGGGEPFLNFEGLLNVARVAQDIGMGIDYIETNSSWFKDEETAISLLRQLQLCGVSQLLVSISPFHNEFIPFCKVKGVLSASRKCGMRVLPWIMDFYSDIDSFNDEKTHALSQYNEKFGTTYVSRIPERYWTHFGGRAVTTYKEILPNTFLEAILKSPPCRELTDTSHFHFDLFGNYIPGLCSGMSISSDDLGTGIDETKYPILTMLFREGIRPFFEFARDQFGYCPHDTYLNKCHLCNDIRRFIVDSTKHPFKELQPLQYYENVV